MGTFFDQKYASRLYYRSLIITCAIGSRISMSSGLIPFELLPKRKFIEVEVKVESWSCATATMPIWNSTSLNF